MTDVSGGAPLLGEPLSIELANTTYAVRGHLREGLETPQHLNSWLRDVRLAIATVDGDPLPADAVDLVNRHAATPARWHELRTDPEPATVARSAGDDVATALSEIAADAVDLFGGPRRHDLRACQGPGCVLYFIRSGRREWCSHGCGNRARAARHYARSRAT